MRRAARAVATSMARLRARTALMGLDLIRVVGMVGLGRITGLGLDRTRGLDSDRVRGLDLDQVRDPVSVPTMVRVPITALVLDRRPARPARLALLRLAAIRLSNTESSATVVDFAKAIVGCAHRFRPTYPDFLHEAPPTSTCAAFIKESRMQVVNASKLNRKSGVRWCERGGHVLFPLTGVLVWRVGDLAQWYPTSREKRARCGAPRVCGQDRDLPSSLVSAFLEVGRAQQ
jgi:hypothetical protein